VGFKLILLRSETLRPIVLRVFLSLTPPFQR